MSFSIVYAEYKIQYKYNRIIFYKLEINLYYTNHALI